MLQDVELVLQDAELMFQDVEDRISGEGKTFFPRARNFFALFACFSMSIALLLADESKSMLNSMI